VVYTEEELTARPYSLDRPLPPRAKRVAPIISPMDAEPDEIIAFTRDLVAANDLAPNYPVLREIIRERGWKEESALWFLLCYITYDHIPSALSAIRILGDAAPPIEDIAEHLDTLNALPVTIHRRYLAGRTGEQLIRILDYRSEYSDTPMRRLLNYQVASEDGFHGLYDYWRRFPGYHHWATFETCRTLRYVRGWDIRAPSLLLNGKFLHSITARNPTLALQRLYGAKNRSIPLYARLGNMFRETLLSALIYLDWELIDILIPKADAFTRGAYYVGYALDEMLAHTRRVRDFHPDDRDLIFAARAASFDPAYLGEVSGWKGVRASRFANPKYWPRILRPKWFA